MYIRLLGKWPLMFYVVFAGTSIDAVMVSILTFCMNFAAYVSEMFHKRIVREYS